MSYFSSTRRGTSMVELIMFIAFFGIASGAVMVLLFGTGEQRKRQEGIAVVDQTGMQLLQTVTRRIRSSERVLDPISGASGSILALQMASPADNPTILAAQSGALVAAERDTVFALTSTGEVLVSDFTVRNTSPADDRPSVQVMFTITKQLGIPSQPTYTRTFEAAVTVFPDDQEQGDDCGCATARCESGVYEWEYCDVNTCKSGPDTITC